MFTAENTTQITSNTHPITQQTTQRNTPIQHGSNILEEEWNNVCIKSAAPTNMVYQNKTTTETCIYTIFS